MAHILASNPFVVRVYQYRYIYPHYNLHNPGLATCWFFNNRTMRKRKLTPDTSNDLHIPETPRKKFKRGSDGDFQTRMEICVLAKRGLTPTQITKTFGCTWDMTSRWSKRSEEVMQTGSVKSNREGKVGPKCIYSTPKAKGKLYNQLKKTTQRQFSKELGHCRKVHELGCNIFWIVDWDYSTRNLSKWWK